MRATKYGTFRNAVFKFHSEGSVHSAQAYLEGNFKAFKDQSDLPKYIKRLDTYAKEFKSLGTELVRTRTNIAVALPATST